MLGWSRIEGVLGKVGDPWGSYLVCVLSLGLVCSVVRCLIVELSLVSSVVLTCFSQGRIVFQQSACDD